MIQEIWAELEKTPNIDALTRSGIRCTHAYTVPWFAGSGIYWRLFSKSLFF